jgi:predicted molibdopterin-dependent oxidoreductase YjgC
VTRRVVDHPILGPAPASLPVTISFAGEPLPAFAGEPVAAALVAAGVRVFRKTSKRGEPRQLFCGIGRCTDCVMVVDGQPNVRTCVTPVREGMKVEVQDGRGVWERPRGDSGRAGRAA